MTLALGIDRRTLHGLVTFGWAVLCIAPSVVATEAGWGRDGSIYPAGASVVADIVPAGEVDLVVLADGIESGFQTGMVCRVRRDGEPLGEVIVAAVSSARSVALILDFHGEARIGIGDEVKIKTTQ
jgi:hypothetical protein